MSKFDIILYNSFDLRLIESIILKFFFLLNNFKATLSIPFPIITSKNCLLSSIANFLFILKLQQTIPPKALTGSHSKANW